MGASVSSPEVLRLFDDVERTDHRSKRFAEPEFPYLNLSARPEASLVRDFVEGCFSRYPTVARPDVRGRYRLDAEQHHLGAVSELIWHELLLRLGCKTQPHPALPGSSTCPEFLVEEPDRSTFYLESVADTTKSLEQHGKERIENELYDEINRLVQSPHFLVGVSLRGALPRKPSLKKVSAKIRQWLDTLDVQYVIGAKGGLPHRRFDESQNGFVLDCDAVPRGAATRESGGPGIGFIWHMSGAANVEDSVRAALAEKATRYGRLDRPYVIAINVMSEYHERVDILDVLFGSLQAIVSRGPSGGQAVTSRRAEDGLWSGPGDRRNNGVSAVLWAVRLDEWRIGQTEVRIVHNPWARAPYAGVLNSFPRIERQGDRLVPVDGSPLRELLGLPPEWPNPES